MKQTPGFLLQRIAGTSYLLPFGQRIAEHRRGISLNETGVEIWNLLENEPSREALRREFAARFRTQPGQEEAAERDLDRFLDQLIALGLVRDDPPAPSAADGPWVYLSIGGLTLWLSCPPALIDAYGLKDFCTDAPGRADQRVRVLFTPPLSQDNGALLLRDRELVVCERETDYLLLFPSFSQIREVSLSKDGAEVVFYCHPPVNGALEYQFFHALRLAFLYLAQKRRMYAIHSASILYRERAWLFSAPAGTGKTTHVTLWQDLYRTAVLNGDLNLLALEGGRPVVHGIPWCGTSGRFDKRTLPLGGIVLLKRAGEDSVEELPLDRRALLILQRFISPMWDAAMLRSGASFAEELSGQIAVCRLRCTKNPSAAELIKGWIDGDPL